MSEYKNIVSVWLNANKEGKGCYLSIKNETNEPMIIEPGKSIFATMNTRMPIASKSVKVEESMTDKQVQDVNDEVPF